MYYRCTYASPIGKLTLASDGENLTGLWMEGQRYFAQSHRNPIPAPTLPIFWETALWLDAYFAGDNPSVACLPLKPAGSDFRQRVWQILLQIPYGQTYTYGQISKMMGAAMSAQAVGGAVGHNPISIIIPCHRVLGAGGSLIGYAGGIAKKLWLLRHEGIAPQSEK